MVMTQGPIDVDALSILRNALLGAAAFAVIAMILWKLVVWARARANGAYVLGALFSPFMGFGDVVDPDFKIVNETKRVKQKEEDDSSDPPSSDADSS
jgi:hypothetical protein